MKRKQSNANRDHCTICYGNGTGSSGHSAQFCAFKNGPYEGRFRDAAIASQASRQQAKKARQQRSNQQGGSSSSGGAPPELSAFLADRLDNDDVAEHGGYEAAAKNPLPFIEREIHKIDDRLITESRAIRDLEQQNHHRIQDAKRQNSIIEQQAAAIASLAAEVETLKRLVPGKGQGKGKGKGPGKGTGKGGSWGPHQHYAGRGSPNFYDHQGHEVC